MRIITWNVNALRTVLPYRPWNDLADKTIRGMLDAMNAEIICFQEHKSRRDQIQKPMAVPDGFDAFFSFPHGKGGYSGTCIYTKTSYAVPLKAEDGITGILLESPTSTVISKGSSVSGNVSSGNKLIYGSEDKIGGYPDEDDVRLDDELNGESFDLKNLDKEGRAVVLDFGFFVILNLYCPNETNETRRPYKMNFLRYLQARVNNLVAQGRNVIVVGDINVCHRPIDNGEGGIQRNAEEHFDHPARRWFDEWVSPKGIMHDVTREAWPNRKGMFTCWNTKLDARPSNYGARIDYILVTKGLLPWVKGSDIQPAIMGSDHCPVYVDLHEEITQPDGTVLRLKDLMNPSHRPPLPACLQVLTDPTRAAPEPPPLATKFWDEFSGKQRSLKDFFGKKGEPPPVLKQRSSSIKPATPDSASTPAPDNLVVDVDAEIVGKDRHPDFTDSAPTTVFDAFAALEKVNKNGITKQNSSVGLTISSKPTVKKTKHNDSQHKDRTSSFSGQPTVSSFFRPASSATSLSSTLISKSRSRSPEKRPSSTQSDSDEDIEIVSGPPDTEQDYMIAKALAEQDEADAVESGNREDAVNSWSSIFAKKVPPRCIVHDLPCKPFITKIPGPNKGKKFWLCSKPVGPGWDNGRSKRPRDEVNTEFRCDFFIWDSAVRTKENGDGPSENTASKKQKKA